MSDKENKIYKLLSLCMPMGMVLYIGYQLYDRYVGPIPTDTKNILCYIAIALLVVGIFCYSTVIGKKNKK